jgi:hypothetical protein
MNSRISYSGLEEQWETRSTKSKVTKFLVQPLPYFS